MRLYSFEGNYFTYRKIRAITTERPNIVNEYLIWPKGSIKKNDMVFPRKIEL